MIDLSLARPCAAARLHTPFSQGLGGRKPSRRSTMTVSIPVLTGVNRRDAARPNVNSGVRSLRDLLGVLRPSIAKGGFAMPRRPHPLRLLLAALVLPAIHAGPAHASEGGTSFYLLGSGGPGNAVLPPVEGIFLDNMFYYYSGRASVSREVPIGGKLVAGLDADIPANFTTLVWVPSTDFLGGTVAVGGILPIGRPSVDAEAVLTGPAGGQIALAAKDSAFVVGDPVLLASLGWKVGTKTHVALSSQVNVPIGKYREKRLANLSFHRWVVDTSLGVSWHDPASGWDVSGKVGVTFNGTNQATNYDTGTELHAEASVEKMLSRAFSAGIQAYRFHQLTGDSGSGAFLGANKGRVTGVGATAAYNFMVGPAPVSARLRLFKEFDAVRRLKAETVMFSVSLPLSAKAPATGRPQP
jgi:hypothetical protein